MKLLFVIAARAGSKSIPKKNVRSMQGKPLICYAIENALACCEGRKWDIVISTDDEEVKYIASRYDVNVINRPAKLAEDEITLDPVIYHALQEMEQRVDESYDVVVTMQPTSPTLKEITLEKAIQNFADSDLDTMISVVNEPHLSWKVDKNQVVPNYRKRLNRQMLPPHYAETGAFLITKRKFISNNGRIGEKVGVFELSAEEAIDIDTKYDWMLCESILQKKKIVLRCDGTEILGMGHIYRCLTLAYRMTGHDVIFVTREIGPLGIEKLEQSFFPMKIICSDEEFFDFLEKYKPDILINDILDTDKQYMMTVQKYVGRVINFEDMGEGAKYADAVINALYEKSELEGNVYNGIKYFFIREEFLEESKCEFHKEVKNMFFMFGGSDPNNYTQRIYNICRRLHAKYPEMNYHIITGLGYSYKNEIYDEQSANIYVHKDERRVSRYMAQADIAVISQGRAIFETAAMALPSIVLAQNSREMRHTFADIDNGFLNMGLGYEVPDELLLQTIEWLINAHQIRKSMREKMLRHDFRKGQKRVLDIIFGENE